MKYIRTKRNGICRIREEDERTISYENSWVSGSLWKDNCKDEIQYADTIEELCDGFDWKWNEKEFPYSKTRQHDRYSGYGDLKRAIREEEEYGLLREVLL